MYKFFDLLLNFSDKKKIDFNKGTLWGVIIFLLSIVVFESIIK